MCEQTTLMKLRSNVKSGEAKIWGGRILYVIDGSFYDTPHHIPFKRTSILSKKVSSTFHSNGYFFVARK